MKRVLVLAVATVLMLLAWAGVASAASAQDIYDDYMANGRITGHYTDAELQAFLGDATLHQYGDPTIVSSLDTIVSSMINTKGRSSFPFTGAQLSLMGVAVLALVAGGFGLRRLGRPRSGTRR